MRLRTSSAVCWVCDKRLPGGNSMNTWVCELSSGGMKPVGNKGMSAKEPMKKAPAPKAVQNRWFKHQRTMRKYTGIQKGTGAGLLDGFNM